jgi:hypothetical protein
MTTTNRKPQVDLTPNEEALIDNLIATTVPTRQNPTTKHEGRLRSTLTHIGRALYWAGCIAAATYVFKAAFFDNFSEHNVLSAVFWWLAGSAAFHLLTSNSVWTIISRLGQVLSWVLWVASAISLYTALFVATDEDLMMASAITATGWLLAGFAVRYVLMIPLKMSKREV